MLNESIQLKASSSTYKCTPLSAFSLHGLKRKKQYNWTANDRVPSNPIKTQRFDFDRTSFQSCRYNWNYREDIKIIKISNKMSTHCIISCCCSSSWRCRIITFSMMARSSAVRCDRSGISAIFLCYHHHHHTVRQSNRVYIWSVAKCLFEMCVRATNRTLSIRNFVW